MKLLHEKPQSLETRNLANSVPVHCDNCGASFLWKRTGGNHVICPSCRATETLDVAAA